MCQNQNSDQSNRNWCAPIWTELLRSQTMLCQSMQWVGVWLYPDDYITPITLVDCKPKLWMLFVPQSQAHEKWIIKRFLGNWILGDWITQLCEKYFPRDNCWDLWKIKTQKVKRTEIRDSEKDRNERKAKRKKNYSEKDGKGRKAKRSPTHLSRINQPAHQTL